MEHTLEVNLINAAIVTSVLQVKVVWPDTKEHTLGRNHINTSIVTNASQGKVIW